MSCRAPAPRRRLIRFQGVQVPPNNPLKLAYPRQSRPAYEVEVDEAEGDSSLSRDATVRRILRRPTRNRPPDVDAPDDEQPPALALPSMLDTVTHADADADADVRMADGDGDGDLAPAARTRRTPARVRARAREEPLPPPPPPPPPPTTVSPTTRTTRSLRKDVTALPTPSTSSTTTSTRSTSSTSASPAHQPSPEPPAVTAHESKPLIVKLSLGDRAASSSSSAPPPPVLPPVLPPTAPADDPTSPRGKRIRKSSRAILEQQEMLDARSHPPPPPPTRKPPRTARRESSARTGHTRSESVVSEQASTVGYDHIEDERDEKPDVKRRKSASGTTPKLNSTCHHDKSRKDTQKMSCTEPNCTLLWCERCINKFYSGPTDPPFVAQGKFLCPVCRGACECTTHQRQRAAGPIRTSTRPRRPPATLTYDDEPSDGEGGFARESTVKRGKRRADGDMPGGFLGQLITVHREAPDVRSAEQDLADSSTHEMSEDDDDDDDDESEDDDWQQQQARPSTSARPGPRLVSNVKQPKVWIEGPLRRDRRAQTDGEAVLERDDADERAASVADTTMDDAGDDEIILYDLIDPDLFPTLDKAEADETASCLPSPAQSAASPSDSTPAIQAPSPPPVAPAISAPSPPSGTSSLSNPPKTPSVADGTSTIPTPTQSPPTAFATPVLPLPSPPFTTAQAPVTLSSGTTTVTMAQLDVAARPQPFAHSPPLATSSQAGPQSAHGAGPSPPAKRLAQSVGSFSTVSIHPPTAFPFPTPSARPAPASHDSYKPSHYASSTPPTIHSHSRPQSSTPMMLVPAPSATHLLDASQLTDAQLEVEVDTSRLRILGMRESYSAEHLGYQHLVHEQASRKLASVQPLAPLDFYPPSAAAAPAFVAYAEQEPNLLEPAPFTDAVGSTPHFAADDAWKDTSTGPATTTTAPWSEWTAGFT